MNFVILPNLIALAVLVSVFWAISRKATSERLTLWLAGWVLVLIHFAAEFMEFCHGATGQIREIVSLDTLLLAGIAFLVSVSGNVSTRRTLAFVVAVPTVAYASAALFGVNSRSLYLGILAAGVILPWTFYWRDLAARKLLAASVIVVSGGVALIAGWAVLRGNPALGTTVIFAALNFAAAVCFARSSSRVSIGVVTTVIGFSLWGAVFPIAAFLQSFGHGIELRPGAWSIAAYLVAVGMILTLLDEQIETCKYHAYHDDLTGLPNRRLLEDRLGLALAHARRAKTKLAVLQLDLDHFKEINDTYGHRVGDVALREVAARLSACVHPGDTLARSGGDEFTVVSQFDDRHSAEALVAALETTLSAPVLIEGKGIQTGLSIGVAIYPDDGIDQDQLHAAADRAMYAAKRAARGSAEDVPDDSTSLSDEPSITMMPTPR